MVSIPTFSLQQAGSTPAATTAFCGGGVEPGGSLAAAGPGGTHGMGKEQAVVSSRNGVFSVRTRTSLGYPLLEHELVSVTLC